MNNEIDSYKTMIAVFCHRFDDANTGGRYADTYLIGACYERDLIFALDNLRITVKYDNFLLEAVNLDELSTADKIEFLLQLSHAEVRARQAAVGFPNAENGLRVAC